MLATCKKEEASGEIAPVKKGFQQSEQKLSVLAGDLLSLQEQIRQQPTAIALRERLLAIALNSTQDSVRAVGIGKIATQTPNLTVAAQGAERAAFIDGCRWLAYLQAWHKDITTPDFGSIQGEVPPAKIIYRHSAADQTVLIVEAELRKTP